jgi:hypothetical protein
MSIAVITASISRLKRESGYSNMEFCPSALITFNIVPNSGLLPLDRVLCGLSREGLDSRNVSSFCPDDIKDENQKIHSELDAISSL